MCRYDHLRIYFAGGLHIDEFPLENEIEIDCPNDVNGIGNIIFHGKSSFYSGQWFSCENFATQFSNIESIFLTTLCDDDEAKPILLWKKHFSKFNIYEYWYRAAVNIKIAINSARMKARLDSIRDNEIDPSCYTDYDEIR